MAIRVTTSEISYDILEYLFTNPDAQDTADGILHWWLLQQQILHNAAIVRDALTDLVNKGLLLARESKDQQTYFRVNRDRQSEIATLLEERRNVEKQN